MKAELAPSAETGWLVLHTRKEKVSTLSKKWSWTETFNGPFDMVMDFHTLPMVRKRLANFYQGILSMIWCFANLGLYIDPLVEYRR